MLTKTYKDILPVENPDDQAFADIIAKVRPYTMTMNEGLESAYALFQSVRYIAQNKIPGDMVECGVWRGGSMMLVAHALKHFGDTTRELHLYDTFAGMTEPDDIDIDYNDKATRPLWLEANKKGEPLGFGGSVEDVKANLLQTGYPKKHMHFIAGDVLQTIPAHSPSQIAILRLDTDWYKSTLHELKHLYHLVVPHGILIIDDYGWCRGSRQATDEFFGKQRFKPFLHRVDQCPRLIVKPA